MHVSDERVLLRGTAANVVGLLAGVAAAFGVQVLLGRSLPAGGLALVTIAVQVAFVASAGARFGMDVAAVRLVAIAAGRRRPGDAPEPRRPLRRRRDGRVHRRRGRHRRRRAAHRRPGQRDRDRRRRAARSSPSRTSTSARPAASSGWARRWPCSGSGSRCCGSSSPPARSRPAARPTRRSPPTASRGSSAAFAARAIWRRPPRDGRPAGAPRGRAGRDRLRRCRARRRRCSRRRSSGATSSSSPTTSTAPPLDAYAAAGRVSQLVLLFLTSANLIFAPFAADLHARGERARLDALFKQATRWALAGTLPRGDRAGRGRTRSAAGVRARLRPGRDAASHHARRPDGERRDRRRRVRAHHGRPHRPRPGRQPARGGRARRARRSARVERRGRPARPSPRPSHSRR